MYPKRVFLDLDITCIILYNMHISEFRYPGFQISVSWKKVTLRGGHILESILGDPGHLLLAKMPANL